MSIPAFQNLQLHRRGHNLPWKLKQRPSNIQVKKRVYVCPEMNCVHHEPARALGNLTRIKKHFCRKHGEKKWKISAPNVMRYNLTRRLMKICGTREYLCDCGTILSRKDSFVTHRAFCDALTKENYGMNLNVVNANNMIRSEFSHDNNHEKSVSNDFDPILFNQRTLMQPCFISSSRKPNNSLMSVGAYTSATALLQKAAEMGARKVITPSLKFY
ncbi:hypothetical protein Tco_0825216 [Tanacetum coccineum]